MDEYPVDVFATPVPLIGTYGCPELHQDIHWCLEHGLPTSLLPEDRKAASSSSLSPDDPDDRLALYYSVVDPVKNAFHSATPTDSPLPEPLSKEKAGDSSEVAAAKASVNAIVRAKNVVERRKSSDGSQKSSLRARMISINSVKELPVKKPRRKEEGYRPDGILRSNWLEKHLYCLPGVLIVMYEFNADDQTSESRIVESFNRLRFDLKSHRFKWLFIAVNRSQRGFSPDIEMRSVSLRKRLDLDSKQFMVVFPNAKSGGSGTGVRASAAKISKLTFDLCQSYYKDRRKRVKKHQERYAKTGAGNTVAKASYELYARHSFKAGVYAEVNGEWKRAIKHYRSAYSMLLQVDPADRMVRPERRMALYVQKKAVSEYIAIKLILIHLFSISNLEGGMDFFRSFMQQYCCMKPPLYAERDRQSERENGSGYDVHFNFMHLDDLRRMYEFLARTIDYCHSHIDALVKEQKASRWEERGEGRRLRPAFYYQGAAQYALQVKASAFSLLERFGLMEELEKAKDLLSEKQQQYEEVEEQLKQDIEMVEASATATEDIPISDEPSSTPEGEVSMSDSDPAAPTPSPLLQDDSGSETSDESDAETNDSEEEEKEREKEREREKDRRRNGGERNRERYSDSEESSSFNGSSTMSRKSIESDSTMDALQRKYVGDTRRVELSAAQSLMLSSSPIFGSQAIGTGIDSDSADDTSGDRKVKIGVGNRVSLDRHGYREQLEEFMGSGEVTLSMEQYYMLMMYLPKLATISDKIVSLLERASELYAELSNRPNHVSWMKSLIATELLSRGNYDAAAKLLSPSSSSLLNSGDWHTLHASTLQMLLVCYTRLHKKRDVVRVAIELADCWTQAGRPTGTRWLPMNARSLRSLPENGAKSGVERMLSDVDILKMTTPVQCWDTAMELLQGAEADGEMDEPLRWRVAHTFVDPRRYRYLQSSASLSSKDSETRSDQSLTESKLLSVYAEFSMSEACIGDDPFSLTIHVDWRGPSRVHFSMLEVLCRPETGDATWNRTMKDNEELAFEPGQRRTYEFSYAPEREVTLLVSCIRFHISPSGGDSQCPSAVIFEYYPQIPQTVLSLSLSRSLSASPSRPASTAFKHGSPFSNLSSSASAMSTTQSTSKHHRQLSDSTPMYMLQNSMRESRGDSKDVVGMVVESQSSPVKEAESQAAQIAAIGPRRAYISIVKPEPQLQVNLVHFSPAFVNEFYPVTLSLHLPPNSTQTVVNGKISLKYSRYTTTRNDGNIGMPVEKVHVYLDPKGETLLKDDLIIPSLSTGNGGNDSSSGTEACSEWSTTLYLRAADIGTVCLRCMVSYDTLKKYQVVTQHEWNIQVRVPIRLSTFLSRSVISMHNPSEAAIMDSEVREVVTTTTEALFASPEPRPTLSSQSLSPVPSDTDLSPDAIGLGATDSTTTTTTATTTTAGSGAYGHGRTPSGSAGRPSLDGFDESVKMLRAESKQIQTNSLVSVPHDRFFAVQTVLESTECWPLEIVRVEFDESAKITGNLVDIHRSTLRLGDQHTSFLHLRPRSEKGSAAEMIDARDLGTLRVELRRCTELVEEVRVGAAERGGERETVRLGTMKRMQDEIFDRFVDATFSLSLPLPVVRVERPAPQVRLEVPSECVLGEALPLSLHISLDVSPNAYLGPSDFSVFVSDNDEFSFCGAKSARFSVIPGISLSIPYSVIPLISGIVEVPEFVVHCESLEFREVIGANGRVRVFVQPPQGRRDGEMVSGDAESVEDMSP